MELLVDLIDFAAKMDSKIVTIGSFKGTALSAGSQEDAFNYLDEALFTADTKAGIEGVKLALEQMNLKRIRFFDYSTGDNRLYHKPQIC